MKTYSIAIVLSIFFSFCSSTKQHRQSLLTNEPIVKEGDTLSILYAYVGHGYSNRKKIEITRVGSNYQCSLFCENLTCEGTNSIRWSGDSIKYILCKKVNLNDAEQNLYRMFEVGLTRLPLHDTTCSNMYGLYTFKRNGTKIEKIDCGEKWNGFSLLQKVLFK